MQHNVTQAIILSAGLGTRLREITGEAIPKVMVPLLGKPLLQWHIEQFARHGVTDFFINLYYLSHVVTDYFGDGSKFDVRITYVVEEPKILGTAGGVKDFEGKLGENFFVIYGDVFSLVDYTKMADAFLEKRGAIGTELVGTTDHPHDSDLAEVDATLRFLRIHQKPHKELPKTYKSMRGVYVFNKKILPHIPADTYYEIDHDLLPMVLQRGEKFYGYECNEFLKDIGTPERYQIVEEYLKK
jgi:mannose-1-phosphate guanylyltransferase